MTSSKAENVGREASFVAKKRGSHFDLSTRMQKQSALLIALPDNSIGSRQTRTSSSTKEEKSTSSANSVWRTNCWYFASAMKVRFSSTKLSGAMFSSRTTRTPESV
jgi:hypothetical protein